MFQGGRGRAVDNTITRAKGTALPDHNGGIVLVDAHALVKDNTVTRFDHGITVGYDSGGKLLGNTVTKGRDIGIYLYGYPDRPAVDPETDPVVTVRGNAVHGFGSAGMSIDLTTPGNLIDHNDFSANPGTDCVDRTSDGDAWHWNKGTDSQPAGLCHKVPKA